MSAVTLEIAGGEALVDLCDLPLISHRSWYVDTHGYAVSRMRVEGGKSVQFAMHRVVMGLTHGDGLEVDHINRNRSDNRRSNLRVCVRRENRQNRPSCAGATSKFRGVYFDRYCDTWKAVVGLDGRKHYLGTFDREIDAARAAEAFRREHMPFATPDPELEVAA